MYHCCGIAPYSQVPVLLNSGAHSISTDWAEPLRVSERVFSPATQAAIAPYPMEA